VSQFGLQDGRIYYTAAGLGLTEPGTITIRCTAVPADWHLGLILHDSLHLGEESGIDIGDWFCWREKVLGKHFDTRPCTRCRVALLIWRWLWYQSESPDALLAIDRHLSENVCHILVDKQNATVIRTRHPWGRIRVSTPACREAKALDRISLPSFRRPWSLTDCKGKRRRKFLGKRNDWLWFRFGVTIPASIGGAINISLEDQRCESLLTCDHRLVL
jgi:hypothetical protein